jgi:hypothetical protein
MSVNGIGCIHIHVHQAKCALDGRYGDPWWLILQGYGTKHWLTAIYPLLLIVRSSLVGEVSQDESRNVMMELSLISQMKQLG